jgi:GAF domain-containing protein
MMKIETGKNKRTLGLTTTLAFAYFGLSLFALLLSSVVQIELNINAQQSALSHKQQLIAQDAGKTVSNFIQEKFSSLETAVEFASPINASAESRKTFMEGLLGIHPAFKQVALLDRQGLQLAKAARSSPILSPQFIKHLQDKTLSQDVLKQRYISPVYIDDATSEPLVMIAIPVKTVLGDAQGILVAEVNLKFMWDLVDQLKVGNTGYAYVVDEQGNLIAYKDTTLVLRGENLMKISEVSEFVRNPILTTDITPGVETYAGLNGSTVVGTYVPLGTPPWAVVIELPRSEAYQSINTLVVQTCIIILVIALLAGIIGSLGSRFAARSLVELSRVAEETAKGNMNLRATPRGPREVINLAVAFNTMTYQLRDLVGSLEERVANRTSELQIANEVNERRAKQFEAITQVSRAINQTRGLQHLLPQITQVISQQFNFYHVGIFLLDANNEYAVLAASNSEGGQRMLARDHKLKVGEVGIVGNVAGTGIPRIALDTGADAIYFNNPDLPETHSEMALPLLVSGQQPIGVIDVQSTEQGAFRQDDIQVLSTLAEQVSIAIANARLYEETQKALLESETFYRRNIKTGWAKFIRSQKLAGIRTQGMKSDLLLEPLELPGAAEVTRSGNIYQHKADDNGKYTQMTIPVKLRGEMVGMLGIKTDEERKLTSDEMDVITAIVERAALSIESARLLAESRTAAEKERAIGEISAKISAGTEIEAILKTAVRELGNQIGGTQISVEIGSDDE